MLKNASQKNEKESACHIVDDFAAIFKRLFYSVPSQQTNKNAANRRRSPDDYAAPQVVGKIDNRKIIESSGIAASPCQSGVLWTHNDSGNEAEIYAIDDERAKRWRHLM